MKKKIGNILPLPPIAVKSELSTQVLSEDEQAMVCEPVRVCDEQSLQGETVPSRRCEQSPYGRWNGQISDLTGGDNAVKSELSTQVLSEDEQAMVCGGFYVGRRVSKADPVRQSGNRLTIDTASKIQESLKRVCDEQSRQGETVPSRRCAEGTKQSIKCLAAFTLAEILLSLTVIGIVAAIALPSLLGNANERAWETQKKALYTRFSQALPLLPSLNGYGQLEEVKNGDDTEILDTAAETFVRDGLSKVMKITNICDNDHLTDCGLPDKIIPLNGGNAINLSNIKSLSKYNIKFSFHSQDGATNYEQLDTKVAAFETVNGESILVYYNPNCEANLVDDPSDWQFIQPKMCANFVYDLNGKKGPNTVGKDIGVITAMYSTDPVVVSPNLNIKTFSDFIDFNQASEKCKELDMKIPTIDELSSLFYNKDILGVEIHRYWSSTSYSSNDIWRLCFYAGRKKPSDNLGVSTLCMKR